eukprot:2111147-Rhodomonas_salina.4
MAGAGQQLGAGVGVCGTLGPGTLSAYARPTRCPALRKRTAGPVYAVSGTEMADGGISESCAAGRVVRDARVSARAQGGIDKAYQVRGIIAGMMANPKSGAVQEQASIPLRACYAMSEAGIAHAASRTRGLCDVRYWRSASSVVAWY